METSPAKPAAIVPPSPTTSSELSPIGKGAGDASPDSAVAELKTRMKRQEKEHARALRKLEEQWRAKLKAQAEHSQQEHSKVVEQVVKRAEEVVSQAQARARAKESAAAAEIKSLQEKLAGGVETPEKSTPTLNSNPLFRTSYASSSGSPKEEGGEVLEGEDGGRKQEVQTPEKVPFLDVQKRLDSAESRTSELAAKLVDAENEVGLLKAKVEDAEKKVKAAEGRVQHLEQELGDTGQMLRLTSAQVQGLEKELTHKGSAVEALQRAENRAAEVGKKLEASEWKVMDLGARVKKAEGDGMRAETAEKRAKACEEQLAVVEKERKEASESLKAEEAKVASLEKELSTLRSKLKDAEGKAKQLEGSSKAAEGKALALEKELAAVKDKLKGAEDRERSLETRFKQVEGELIAAKKKVEDLETEVANAAAESERLAKGFEAERNSDVENRVADMTKELSAAREEVKSFKSKLSALGKESDELRAQLAASEKGGSTTKLNQQLETANKRNEGLEKSLSEVRGNLELAQEQLASERERVKVLETKVKEGDAAGLRLKEAERQLAESKDRAAKTTEEVTKLRNWSDKIEASLEALQQEKAEKEKQLAESQRDCEHLRNALAAERSALASQRSQRESDVAMLVRQVTGLQQQLQRAEDIKNQALRSADEHSQREDHLIREVDDLKQQISGFMSAKKSFREVTLEGEIAQLKGRAEDAAIWRVRLGEVERRLQDAEYREQKHLSVIEAEEERRARAQETIHVLEKQLEATEKGEGELEATIIDVTERVQAAEEQAAEAVKRAEEYQEAFVLKEAQLASKEAAHKEALKALKRALDEHARLNSQFEEATRKLRAATEVASREHHEKVVASTVTPSKTTELPATPSTQALRTPSPAKGGPKLRKRNQTGKEKKRKGSLERDDWELLAIAQKQNRKYGSYGVMQMVLCSALSCAAGVAATCQMRLCSWLPL